MAKVLYVMGRLHMHHGWASQALRLFQLGQASAQESGEGRAVAMLHANLAWSYAALGDSRQAVACIGRARDEFGRCEHDPAPPWLAFFDAAEVQAMRGTALAHLTNPTPEQRDEAIDRFAYSTALRELPFARSRAFELTARPPSAATPTCHRRRHYSCCHFVCRRDHPAGAVPHPQTRSGSIYRHGTLPHFQRRPNRPSRCLR